MRPRFEFDICLLHTPSDKDRVRKLGKRLRDAGLYSWFCETHALVQQSDANISWKLETSRVLFVCMSPEILESDWIAVERVTLPFRDPGDSERRFIPLILEDCEIPASLRGYRIVDYRDARPAAFHELLVGSWPAPSNSVGSESAQTGLIFWQTLSHHDGWIWSIAVDGGGTVAVTGSDDRTAKVWELATGEQRSILEGHDFMVGSVAITADGTRAVTGSADGTVRVWDTNTGRSLHTIPAHGSSDVAVSISRDGKYAVSGGGKNPGKLCFWDIESGESVATVSTGSAYVRTVAFVGNQRIALSGHDEGYLKLWDMESDECLATLKGHSKPVHSVYVSADGTIAVSASEDRTVRLWDIRKESCIGTLEARREQFIQSLFLPKQSLLQLQI